MSLQINYWDFSDHDYMQETYISNRPFCIICGSRIIEQDQNVVCNMCIKKQEDRKDG